MWHLNVRLKFVADPVLSKEAFNKIPVFMVLTLIFLIYIHR